MRPSETDGALHRAADRLRACGCIAPREEAAELLAASGGDAIALDELIARRCEGEPLAWLVGSVLFAGARVAVWPGVYVPRPQSELLVRAALARLPACGLAADLCTGCGALAVAIRRCRPEAHVVAGDVDPRAVACARANGVEAYEGDLAAALPERLSGRVDVVTAVAPYVPSGELPLLPRDVVAFEPRLALDGGADGTDVLRRAAADASRLLRAGGSLLLELGGDEADLLHPFLTRLAYRDVRLLRDEEGDLRGLVCRRE